MPMGRSAATPLRLPSMWGRPEGRGEGAQRHCTPAFVPLAASQWAVIFWRPGTSPPRGAGRNSPLGGGEGPRRAGRSWGGFSPPDGGREWWALPVALFLSMGHSPRGHRGKRRPLRKS